MQKRFSKTEIQICGECRGEGRIYREIEPARHGSDTGSGTWEECSTCTGSGMVSVTKNIIITIEPHHTKLSL